MRLCTRGMVTVALLAFARGTWLSAQGLTGAAIEGSVRDSAGRAVPSATILVVKQATGERWTPVLTQDGRFLLEHVSSGGPYLITVRAIGFRPVAIDSIHLAEGQRYRAMVVLAPAPVAVPEVTVTTQGDPRLGPARIGPESRLEAERVSDVPNSQRNLINLAATSPSLIRFEFNGWNGQLTAYQADGGQGSDLYSGGQTGRLFPAPVPFEAISEFRTQAAPYDVRIGQVSTGVISVHTIEGTNSWTGSLYGVFQSERLVAEPAAVTPFVTWSGGAVLTGPLIRNRLHLAFVGDLTHFTIADRGPVVTDTAGNADMVLIGVSYQSAERFRRILADTWGLDSGTLGALNTQRPRVDLWAKLSAQLGRAGVLDLTQRVAHASESGAITRGARGQPYRTGSTTREDLRDVVETRLAWRVQPSGRWSNELVAGFRVQRDGCHPAGDFPRLLAAADEGFLAAGADSACGTTQVDQQGVEMSEHATFVAGRHGLTAGGHAEWFQVEDPILIGSQGLWQFRSLDELEAGKAWQYDRVLPGPLASQGPSAAFSVRSVGLYLQDRIALGRAQLTIGLRADRPTLPDAGRANPTVQAALGLTTGRPPDTKVLLSPRAGVAWDVTGRGTTWVRGGAGIFTGRPPYRWLSGIYRGSGGEQSLLTCSGADVPAFDPRNQPTTCGNGARPTGQIAVFDARLRFPQVVQASVGVDRALPAGFVFTADVLAGQALSTFRYRDTNLTGPVGYATGEGNRPLYGTISPVGLAVPNRPAPSLGPVVLVDRGQRDRSLAAAASLVRPLRGWWGFEAHYRWTQAKDRQSLETFDPLLNLGSTPLVGTQADRGLAPSLYDARHKVMAQVTLALPLRSTLSILHVANNGAPYSYVVEGDANADGLGRQSTGFDDLVYVPRSTGDIRLVQGPGGAPALPSAYATLDSVIAAEPCLGNHRGALSARNECTNPWVQFTNARLVVQIPLRGSQRLEAGLDVFNLPNLLNGEWGITRQVASGPSVRLLRLVGWDAIGERGVYQLLTPPSARVVEASSRWRLQLTARYRF